MIRIILHGAYGRMGRMITDIVSRDENTMITAGVDALVSAAPETAAENPLRQSESHCVSR